MKIRDLRAICQKGADDPFLISRYFYRPVTIHITRLYLLLGASANTVTFHSLIAGLIAFAFAFSTEPWHLLVVALAVQVYFVLDHVDGEVARYRVHRGLEKQNLAGTFFDLWVHLHTYNLAFAAVGISLFRQTGSLIWPVLGLLACNISGSYQRLCLGTVLSVDLMNGRIPPGHPGYSALLGADAGSGEAAPLTAQGSSAIRRMFQLGAQLLLFPGNIMGLTLACTGDFVLSLMDVEPVYFRCAWLAVYCLAGIASKAYRTRTTIRDLRAAGESSAVADRGEAP